jgi:hypothetical protein
MKLVGHVAHVGEIRSAYRILVEKPKRRDHLEARIVDGRIILKCILK